MFRVLRTSAALLAAFAMFSAPASGQSLTTVNAVFDAWTPGDKETMKGKIRINVLLFGGTVTGRTTRGVKCSGTVTVNILFTGGSGSMSCNDGRKGNFTYTLTSSLPPRGTGIGKLNNGKIVKFRIKPK
ncbi:MAG: hypothetical protein ACR2OX_13090 [Methyloligellaceae bacterium]